MKTENLNNPAQFIKKYVKIQTPLVGTQSFDLYPFQEDLLDKFNNNRFNIVQKSRQLGISTLMCAMTLWFSLYNSNKHTLFVVPSMHIAKSLCLKFKFMYNSLPDEIKSIKIIHDATKKIIFENNSSVTFMIANADSGRGEAVDLLIFDELAYMSNSNDVYTALFSTICYGGKIIISSTTKERKEDVKPEIFEQLFTDENNSYVKTQLPWNVHPARTLSWYERECKSLSQAAIQQELLATQCVRETKKDELTKNLRDLKAGLEMTLTAVKKLLEDYEK